MEERCVVCGEIVPEGRQVCPMCEAEERCENCYCFENGWCGLSFLPVKPNHKCDDYQSN